MNLDDPNNGCSQDRICPGCGKEFVSNHKSRKFCSDVCYNNHYNSKIRNNQIHRLQQQDYCVVAIRTLIGDSTSSTVPIDALDSIGFPFDQYSSREKYSPISDSYYIWYGPYRLNLTLENQIQIILKNE
jgi:hypothetical protein